MLLTKLRYWYPVVLWMAIIFTMSSFGAVQSSDVHAKEFLIKKTAHLIEYAILWSLNYRAIRNTTLLSRYNAGLTSLIISVGYAATDEFHQTLIPSREGRLRDVFIDLIGISLALLCTYYWLPRISSKVKLLSKSK